jgi:hypothetical protein
MYVFLSLPLLLISKVYINVLLEWIANARNAE